MLQEEFDRAPGFYAFPLSCMPPNYMLMICGIMALKSNHFNLIGLQWNTSLEYRIFGYQDFDPLGVYH